MRLVITEKPSVAKSISAVLGANKRQDGYLEGNDYLVSWCFGHLAELASADVYDEAYGKWSREQLPIIPDNWQYSVGRDKKKQLDLLSDLMRREDVTEVINACDAGREGELIFRTVYQLAGCKKPMKRLWISSMEDNAIREGFAQLRDGSEYDNLYAAALCRSKADWLVGINATRLFSVLYHRTLNVGRVVSPTLSLLVQREAEIKAFQPEPFYTVKLDTGDFAAVSEKMKEKPDAEKLKESCTGSTAVVRNVEQKEKSEKAPALYDLTTLQRDANRILGFTAQQTLDYLQSLYEKKLCTYPRTDSRFLTDDMEASVSGIADIAAGICGMSISAVNSAQVCNSKKVSDHHAVIPTESAGKQDISALSAGEREVLKLVARQVLMAVGEPYSYMETVVTVDCGGQSFTAKGKTVLNAGWKTYADNDKKETVLPPLTEGQVLDVFTPTIEEGKTKPPAHFTEDTLLSAMERAGAKEMPDDAERKGLGTPATRAGILEKLVSAGFVERKKNKKAVNLIPQEVGISLITVLPEQLQSPLLTAEWENRLKEIEYGNLSPDNFMDGISQMVSDLVRNYEVMDGADVLFPSGRPVVGKCPRCGGSVTESKTGFFCERQSCRFGLWKDNRYLSAKHIILTKKMAEGLLKDGKTFVSGMYSEKTGKTYSAYIVLSDDGQKTSYSLEFDKNGK
jgi:DNA topoisomerase III